jgi:hypothetical protein
MMVSFLLGSLPCLDTIGTWHKSGENLYAGK